MCALADAAALRARIIGTAMALPGMVVGGVQAVRDISQLPSESEEARTVSRTLSEAADAQRARANRLTVEASKQAQIAAPRSLAWRAAKLGVVASYGVTPTGGALIAGSPPDVLLTEQQKRRDEAARASITPEGGMPKDVRLDMRVNGVSRVKRQ